MLTPSKPWTPSSGKTPSWLPGLLLISLLMLMSGCATHSGPPQIITRTVETQPPPLPETLIQPLQPPDLPPRRLTHEDLLHLLADYHRLLNRANTDRQLIQDLWPNDRPHSKATQ